MDAFGDRTSYFATVTGYWHASGQKLAELSTMMRGCDNARTVLKHISVHRCSVQI